MVVTTRNALLATSRNMVAEMDRLVAGDGLTPEFRRVELFVEDPAIRMVRTLTPPESASSGAVGRTP